MRLFFIKQVNGLKTLKPLFSILDPKKDPKFLLRPETWPLFLLSFSPVFCLLSRENLLGFCPREIIPGKNTKKMTLKQYAKHIEKLASKFPNVEVIYAKDAEGNGFEPVVFPPSVGNYDARLGLFTSEKPSEISNFNAVCIN